MADAVLYVLARALYQLKMVGPDEGSGSGTKTDSVNFNDPLYIHSSDNTGTNVVMIKLSWTKNFCVWRSPMIRNLKARNKLWIVDGSIKKDSSYVTTSSKW